MIWIINTCQKNCVSVYINAFKYFIYYKYLEGILNKKLISKLLQKKLILFCNNFDIFHFDNQHVPLSYQYPQGFEYQWIFFIQKKTFVTHHHYSLAQT
jgi:hypothetical protein